MELGSFLQTTTLISAILTILLILLQRRGASLGAGFGGSGELFTTNCVGYDSNEFADDDALIAKLEKIGAASSPAVIYGGISEEGAIALSETKPSVGPVLLAVEYTTMPDGTDGIKFQVVSA